MRLSPTPIPSNATNAPIIPGTSLEMFDLLALLALVSPGFFFLRAPNPNPRLAALAALPGLIASIWLVFMPPNEAQRGWQRLLARFNYQFMSTKQYRVSVNNYDDEVMEVVRVGKTDWRK